MLSILNLALLSSQTYCNLILILLRWRWSHTSYPLGLIDKMENKLRHQYNIWRKIMAKYLQKVETKWVGWGILRMEKVITYSPLSCYQTDGRTDIQAVHGDDDCGDGNIYTSSWFWLSARFIGKPTFMQRKSSVAYPLLHRDSIHSYTQEPCRKHTLFSRCVYKWKINTFLYFPESEI